MSAPIVVPVGCFWQEDPVQRRLVRVWRAIPCSSEKVAAFTRQLYDVTPEHEALYARWLAGDETAVVADDAEEEEDEPERIVRSLAAEARSELRAQLGAAPDAGLVARQVAEAARPEDVRRILAWALVDLVREAGDAELRVAAAPDRARPEAREREPRVPVQRTAVTRQSEVINAAFAGSVQVTSGYKALEDCTADDLDWIADQHAARARGELASAVRFRRLATALRDAGAARVADLPAAKRTAAMETAVPRQELALEASA